MKPVILVDQYNVFDIMYRVQKSFMRTKKKELYTNFMQKINLCNNFNDFIDVVREFAIIKEIYRRNNSSFDFMKNNTESETNYEKNKDNLLNDTLIENEDDDDEDD